jgi:hypothetical protein
LPPLYTPLTKKLRGCCASASKQIELAFNLCGICRAPALPRETSQEEAMNTLFQAEESSFDTVKRIVVVVAGLALLGLAVWAGIAMALRVAQGR